MSAKKILYVQHTGANGGATMSLFYLLEYVKKEFNIVVYFISEGPAIEFYKNAGIRCVVNKSLGKLAHCHGESQSLNPCSFKFYRDVKAYLKNYLKLIPSYCRMKAIIAEEKPDIVHLNSSVLISEGLAVKLVGVPLIWHIREFLEYGKFKIRYRLLRKLIGYCADVIIALSKSELERIAPTKESVIIPNFVNLDKFNYLKTNKVNLRGQLGISPDSKIIAILGWHSPVKGALPLMKAFAEIKDKQPNSVLVFFGEGPIKADNSSRIKNFLRSVAGRKNLRIEIQKIIDANQLSDRVFFPGVIFDLASYIAEVDVIAVPFTQSHFARPILEAGAMKKIVVASDLDGTREMILNGKAGYLAKPGDIHDWSQQLDLALSSNNQEKIELMYENTLLSYNADINAEKTINQYKSVLASA